MTPALEIRGLHAPFGQRPGLTGISCALTAGERLAVLGPSGAGKTTLLRAIAGLAPLSQGTISVRGVDVTTLPAERRGAVYLHQTPLLFPHLDVAANVAFPLTLRGIRGDAAATRVELALKLVQLEGFGARRATALSGGQRQRVTLARAFCADAAVLLLDEPLAALDPALRQEVRDALLAIAAAPGAPAMVLATHDLDDAGLLAERALVLLNGSVAQLATAETVFRAPGSPAVAQYLGWPTQLRGRWRDGLVESVLGVHRPGRVVHASAQAAPGAPEPNPTDAGPAPRIVSLATSARSAVTEGTAFHLAARADALVLDPEGVLVATVLARRVRADGVTWLLQIGDARVEAVHRDGTGTEPAPGESVRVRVDAMRLHAFELP